MDEQTAKVLEQLTLAYSFFRDPEIGRAIDEIKRLTKVIEELQQQLEKANGRME